MDATKQFRKYLSQKGLKVTSERLAVGRAILAAPGHFQPDALLGRLRGDGVQVSRATLYRTLAHLLEAGMVQRLAGPDGNPRYESMSGRKRHDHMVCLGCGAILEFADPGIDRLQQDACRRAGFTSTDHALRIEGYCRRCTPQGD